VNCTVPDQQYFILLVLAGDASLDGSVAVASVRLCRAGWLADGAVRLGSGGHEGGVPTAGGGAGVAFGRTAYMHGGGGVGAS
jgi:hypothetical protein